MDDRLAVGPAEAWARSQFGTAEIGDQRRTRRLVKLAAQMASHSSGSIPQQTGCTGDMKAAYRLFAGPEVTHAAICRPHFEQTRQAAGRLPMVFLLQDTTILNFTSHQQCQGLGPIGCDERMRGLHQQNVLAADPASARPLGLLYQRHHRRRARSGGSHGQRPGRGAVPLEERESYWWIEAIRTIGRPPEGVRWVHVGDRGEDIFGVYDQCRQLGADWLIRICQNRKVETPQGVEPLFDYARRLPCVMRQTMKVRRRVGGTPQEAIFCVAGGPLTLLPTPGEPGYRGCEPVPCWVVRVWEASPADGVEPLEWLLCTSLPCQEKAMLGFVARGYGLRWMVEELHKCEKTGCQVEMRRLQHTDRLEPLIGLLSVLAVRLLQLKYVARDHPQTPAIKLFDPTTVDAMARYLACPASTLTVRQFWRGLGRLGGHPGRKGDGPLGWLRAWRGWQSFQLILLGADLYRTPDGEKSG